MTYQDFLNQKTHEGALHGFDPVWMPPQPSGGHLIRKGQLWGGYQPRPQSGTPSAPPESP